MTEIQFGPPPFCCWEGGLLLLLPSAVLPVAGKYICRYSSSHDGIVYDEVISSISENYIHQYPPPIEEPPQNAVVNSRLLLLDVRKLDPKDPSSFFIAHKK